MAQFTWFENQMEHTVRKRNNLTTSITLLDELPVSDLFSVDKESGDQHTFMIIPGVQFVINARYD